MHTTSHVYMFLHSHPCTTHTLTLYLHAHTHVHTLTCLHTRSGAHRHTHSCTLCPGPASLRRQRAHLHGSGAEAQQILLQGLEERDTRTPGLRQARRPLRGLPRGAVLRGKREAHQGPRGPASVLPPPEGARAALAVRPPRGGLLPAGRLRAAGRPGQPPPAGAHRPLLPASGLRPAIIAKRGSAYVLRHTPALHREQRGLSPREAELRFIREACRLEDVPVHFFRLYKDKKEDRPTVVLGLTLRGVQVFQEVNRTPQLLYDFPWPHVEKLAFLGERFELWPHGQPAARRLVYHTGCAWRSRHLLRLLRTSHQLHLGLQQARQQLQQLEEAEEKQSYRESYVSDARDPEAAGSGDHTGADRHPPSLRSLLWAGSRCSSHAPAFKVGPQRAGPAEPGEMSVDEPEGVAELPTEEPPYSPSTSRSSPGTVGSSRDPGSRGGSWTHRPAQPKPGPHTPRARPAPGTPQPCPRPSAAPWAEGLREVPVAQPAPEGPAPGGVCGVDTSGGCFNTAGLGPRHPLHPPGALSLQHGSVHSGLRPPPGSVPLSVQATPPPTPPPPQRH
ncbi:FERM domain-containing protein 1 isoform X3 [Ovis aries]|uniref:FERM domain-containing protein 1 isoform X3 n=1 Tax=Ovis aries TaxID=9940 RepID=UPI00295263CD|nr:FERM domain-containing protein 1 isoform X3 [Ovis aries]